MNRALINSLKEPERLLLAETETAALRELTEDELLALHKRVRRQRNKVTSIYRRGGAQKVKKKGGRGKAAKGNQRNRDRVEAFEDALARVSRALGTAAAASARVVREERLAAARAARASGPARAGTAPAAAATKRTSASGATTRASARKTPVTRKKAAATRATGARRQATRDAR